MQFLCFRNETKIKKNKNKNITALEQRSRNKNSTKKKKIVYLKLLKNDLKKINFFFLFLLLFSYLTRIYATSLINKY